MDDGFSPRKRRRAQPSSYDVAGADSSSTPAYGARATRRQSARASQSGNGRVSYAPAYPELDDDDDNAGPVESESSRRNKLHRRAAQLDGKWGEDNVGEGDESNEQADNEDDEASPVGLVTSARMRPQRSRRNLRVTKGTEEEHDAGELGDAGDDATAKRTPGMDSRRGSANRRIPTGRSRGRPRKDVTSSTAKGETPTSDPPANEDEEVEDQQGNDEDQAINSSGEVVQRHARSKSQTSSPSKRLAQEDRAASGKRRARSREEAYAGWIEEVDTDEEARELFLAILTRLRQRLAEEGNVLVTSFLEGTAADGTTNAMSLQQINDRVDASEYSSSIDFEKDMLHLFQNGRRRFEIGSEEYGIVVILQRMYQHVTQSVEAVHGEISDDVKGRNYSSVQYGPCENPPEEERYGESPALAAKVPTKLRYKGRRIVTGNWIHLANPTDPARPIVAQVFKTRSEDLGDHNQDWITACWFLRPEQTRHTRAMQFWDNEVVKTTMLIEHHIEDVLEFVCVMFPPKYIRGRPADGEGGWHTGDPIYVCEYRYNVEQSLFTPIKNWASGMPEDTKSKRFDMIEFDEPQTMPEKLASPFLRGVDGPGELVSEMQLQTEATTNSAPFSGAGINATPAAGRRKERDSSAKVDASDAEGIPMLFKEWADEVVAQKRFLKRQRKENKAREAQEQEQEAQRSQSANASQSSPLIQSSPGDVPGSRPGLSVSPNVSTSAAGAGKTASVTPSRQALRTPLVAPPADRSLMQTMNKMPDASGHFKPLSMQAQQLFLQDPETGAVLWHASPPVTAPTMSNIQRRWNAGERFHAHSLDYLYALASSGPAKRSSGRSSAMEEPADVSMDSVADTSAALPSAALPTPSQSAPSFPRSSYHDKESVEALLSNALRQAGRTLSERYDIVAEDA